MSLGLFVLRGSSGSCVRYVRFLWISRGRSVVCSGGLKKDLTLSLTKLKLMRSPVKLETTCSLLKHMSAYGTAVCVTNVKVSQGGYYPADVEMQDHPWRAHWTRVSHLLLLTVAT